MGKFVVSTRKNGEFQFNLKAGNGQGILASEGYSSKASCLNGIESVKKNSADESKFDIKTSTNGIASVMKNAPDATTEEDNG